MNNPEKKHAQLISSEAAQYIGVSIKTLQASRRTGYLLKFPAPPHRRIGHRTVVYSIEDLDTFITQTPKGVYSVETQKK